MSDFKTYTDYKTVLSVNALIFSKGEVAFQENKCHLISRHACKDGPLKVT